MPYGTIKVDNITFTNGGSDQTVTVSGLYASTSGNLTVTGTVSGTTANFASGTFSTQVSGATVTGNVGKFTTITGGSATLTTATITSGIFAAGTAAAPSVAVGVGTTNSPGIYSPGTDQLALATNGTRRLLVDSTGALTLDTSDATIYGVRVGRGAGAISNNTAIGASCLNANTTGSQNTAVGNLALTTNTTGQYNTAIGVAALNTNNGNNNTAVGRVALYFNSSGGSNVAIGHQALYNNTSGSNNIGIGLNAGDSLTTGNNNTIIGSISGTAGLSDTVIIGAGTAERLRIDSSGRLLVGTTSAPGGFNSLATIDQAGTYDYGLLINSSGGTKIPTLWLRDASTTNAGLIVGQAGLKLATNNSGTTALTIDTSQRVLVGTTSATANGGVLQVSNGITFPATQSACSDANTLDDYEEGTWTPNQGVGLTVAGTFNSFGVYTKIGRMVVVQARVGAATSIACAAGGIVCTNLPFQCASGVEYIVGSSTPNSYNTAGGCMIFNNTQILYNTQAVTSTLNIFYNVTYFV